MKGGEEGGVRIMPGYSGFTQMGHWRNGDTIH